VTGPGSSVYAALIGAVLAVDEPQDAGTSPLRLATAVWKAAETGWSEFRANRSAKLPSLGVCCCTTEMNPSA
jgi:hypothetical protein